LHYKNVLEYFKNRPDDLLIIDICAGQGWEKLCPFLDKPLPQYPFPEIQERANLKTLMSHMVSDKGHQD
jgi:hypothetical protein